MAPAPHLDGSATNLSVRNTFLHATSDDEDAPQPEVGRSKTAPSTRTIRESLEAADKAKCTQFDSVVEEALFADDTTEDSAEEHEAVLVRRPARRLSTRDSFEDGEEQPVLMPRDVTRDWFESPVGRQRAVGFAGASWAAPPPSAGHTAQATHAAQTAAAGAAASRLEAAVAQPAAAPTRREEPGWAQCCGTMAAQGDYRHSQTSAAFYDGGQPQQQQQQHWDWQAVQQQQRQLQHGQWQQGAMQFPVFFVPAMMQGGMQFPGSQAGTMPFVQTAPVDGAVPMLPLLSGDAAGAPWHAAAPQSRAPASGEEPAGISATRAPPMARAPAAATGARRSAAGGGGPACQDGRTTVMLRNLPNNYTRAALVEMIDAEGFAGRYDFLYFPIDFRTHAALGYAFLNLVTPEDAEEFRWRINGFSRWSLPSSKVCSVGWSHPHQGLEAHIARYRNSPLFHDSVPDAYRPILFKNGVRVPFPEPTKKIKPPRQGTERMLV